MRWTERQTGTVQIDHPCMHTKISIPYRVYLHASSIRRWIFAAWRGPNELDRMRKFLCRPSRTISNAFIEPALVRCMLKTAQNFRANHANCQSEIYKYMDKQKIATKFSRNVMKHNPVEQNRAELSLLFCCSSCKPQMDSTLLRTRKSTRFSQYDIDAWEQPLEWCFERIANWV